MSATDLTICTDRPTKANYACTVPSGHFQYESDVVNASFVRQSGSTLDTLLIINPTLKYGLTESLDLQANLSPAEIVQSKSGGSTSTSAGLSDLYLRLKYEFLRTGDEKWQMSVLPYLKVPTARVGVGNGYLEGGSIFPLNVALSGKIIFSTAPELDVFKDKSGAGHHLNTAQLVNLAELLPFNLTLYEELWWAWNFDRTGTVEQRSADVAVTYGFTKRLQADIGINFGLNRDTPREQAYLGLSQLF